MSRALSTTSLRHLADYDNTVNVHSCSPTANKFNQHEALGHFRISPVPRQQPDGKDERLEHQNTSSASSASLKPEGKTPANISLLADNYKRSISQIELVEKLELVTKNPEQDHTTSLLSPNKTIKLTEKEIADVAPLLNNFFKSSSDQEREKDESVAKNTSRGSSGASDDRDVSYPQVIIN